MLTINPDAKHLFIQTLAACATAVLLSLFGYAMTHQGLSWWAFLLVPFCTGLVIAFMSKGRMIVAICATTSLFLSLSILLWGGFEGIVCVVMALPILSIGIGFGAFVGHLIGKKFVHKYGNLTVVAACASVLTLVGWADGEPKEPQILIVRTSMEFRAPMKAVWESVRESAEIRGDDSTLRLLGLPVPQSCVLSDDGTRVCHFEEGEMVQRVTSDVYGESFEVEIVESLHVRDWISFLDAGYSFEEHDGFVRVVRTDRIKSTLRPRWYWHWFEQQCVRLEHDYVLKSMRASAEAASTFTSSAP